MSWALVKATLTRWWWVVVGVVVGVAAIVAGILFSRRPELPPNPLALPPAMRAKVDAAEEQVLRAKVTAKVTAEGQRAELDRVMAQDDAAKRRADLAALLSRL